MSERHPLLCNLQPWNHCPNDIWLGSTIALHRNLEKFHFPAKLESDKANQIVALLSSDILASEQLQKPTLIKSKEMLPIEREFLIEHFLSYESFQQAHSGEAFIVDQTGEFLGIINLFDHLVLKAIDTREELEQTWQRLVHIENSLNQTINYAFSTKFGFLTSDSAQCGTGLVGYIFLHVPALIALEEFEDVIQKHADDTIQQTGLQGDPNEIIGDLAVFHNTYTLGVTEESILSSLRTLATKLLVEERGCRSRLKHEQGTSSDDIKDRVSRAYGVLLHSYQMETLEALESISLMKLGLDLGWVQGTTQAILNQIFFSSRRAHLFCHYGVEKMNQDELLHRRAEFIHQALKGLTLVI